MAVDRGTTPVHYFDVDLDLTDAEVIYITYKQGNKTVLEKEKKDIVVTTEQLSFKLTQEETLELRTNPTASVEIQIRARFPDGTAVDSNIMKAPVGRILKDGVI